MQKNNSRYVDKTISLINIIIGIVSVTIAVISFVYDAELIRYFRPLTDSHSEAVERGSGTIKLQSIPPAEIFINGKSLGWTPLMNVILPSGDYLIRLRHKSGQVFKLDVSIRKNESAFYKCKRLICRQIYRKNN